MIIDCKCTECDGHTGRWFDGSHNCSRDAGCGCSREECIKRIGNSLDKEYEKQLTNWLRHTEI